MGPTLGEALLLGLSGLGRERWLVAVGLLTALLRWALGLPVLAAGLLLLLRGAWRASELAPGWVQGCDSVNHPGRRWVP